jgi:molecular chaperone DnaK (HSP70)
MGLPFLLAEALRSQIYNIQSSLGARTNLASLIYSVTSAILEADEVKMGESARNTLTDVKENIDTLREAYEPIMDNPESIEATSKKRTDYEQLLDITTKQLMFIVHKFGLVDASMMQPVEAKAWDDFK